MIFFLRQYLISVPDEILEAAKIDGSSYFRLFSTITFPLIKPAIAAQLILWFMAIWNDYLAPIIYLNSPEKQTLQLVIANFNATYAIQTDYPLIMAASVIALLPVLLIFLIFQKQIIESVAISALKVKPDLGTDRDGVVIMTKIKTRMVLPGMAILIILGMGGRSNEQTPNPIFPSSPVDTAMYVLPSFMQNRNGRSTTLMIRALLRQNRDTMCSPQMSKLGEDLT